MTISILLCTYNGEKYVEEQLDSIRNQTRRVDEVVIVDDNSTDGTFSLITCYIKTYSLFHWKIYKNENNIGWKKNFVLNINLIKGDLVFFCDQDDIWEKHKIEKMYNIMNSRYEVQVLAANYSPIYSLNRRNKVPKSFLRQMKSDETLVKINLTPKTLYVMRPGCTYCFRRDIYEKYKKYWFSDCPHDSFIWRIGSLNDGLYIYNYFSMKYRRHESNVCMGKGSRDGTRKMLNEYLREYQMLLYIYENEKNISLGTKDILKNEIDYINLRIKFLEDNDIRKLLQLIFKYFTYYRNYRGVLKDTLYWLKDEVIKE